MTDVGVAAQGVTEFPGVHDRTLVAYQVDHAARRLWLSVKPLDTDAPRTPFTVVFDGYTAHQFPFPLLPAILDGIYRVEPERLLAEEWPQLEAGGKNNGWPGPWATSLPAAIRFASSSRLNGYRIESSYGLYGWVLAASVSKRNSAPVIPDPVEA
jgi:hypothetical protein